MHVHRLGSEGEAEASKEGGVDIVNVRFGVQEAIGEAFEEGYGLRGVGGGGGA